MLLPHRGYSRVLDRNDNIGARCVQKNRDSFSSFMWFYFVKGVDMQIGVVVKMQLTADNVYSAWLFRV